MGETTKIQWAHHTWNPWRGCEHALLPDGTPHPGCLHCYAETMSKRNPAALGVWGPEGPRIRGAETYLRQPHQWDIAAAASLQRHRVFFSLGDPFEDYKGMVKDCRGETLQLWRRKSDDSEQFTSGQSLVCPYVTLDDLRRIDLFPTIDACSNLDFLLLTKRPKNAGRMWVGPPRDNVWLLYSASDQESLISQMDHVLGMAYLAPVIGLSLEPLVGPIHIPDYSVDVIRWVIVGGESGASARLCDVAWIRSIVEQCEDFGIPCFVKQLGSLPILPQDTVEQHRSRTAEIYGWPDGTTVGNPTGNDELNGRCLLLADKKGGDPAEWPEDLRVRDFPRVEVAA